MLHQEALKPTEKVLERLESAQTIRHPSKCGALDLPSFGRVDWYVRLEGVASRRVGVARGNGMLITRRAEKLQRFSNTKPFDLFACVVDDEGSKLLRKLENPEHTEFSADRINDPADRKLAERAYQGFTDAIRSLVSDLASIEQVAAVDVDDLDDFFRADFGTGPEDEKGEPNRSLRVGARRRRTHRENMPVDVSGTTGETTPGGAPTGGEPSDRGARGGGSGAGTASGRGSLKAGLPVRDLRIVRAGHSTGIADVAFTPVDGSRQTLVLLRSGEAETEPIQFRTEEDSQAGAPWRTSLRIPGMDSTARKRVRLHFHPTDLEFAIEGRLIP
jgi:hypothetical protein